MTHDLFSSSFIVETPVLMVRERAGKYRQAGEAEVLQVASQLLERNVVGRHALENPQAVKDYVSHRLGLLQHEVFAILFLDAQNCVIEYSEIFRGTLTQTSVYPREIAKESLLRNAAAVILVHNHPSGQPEPSRADEYLTQTLKSALGVLDIRVLDHLVVGGKRVTSFAERGLL